MDKIWIVFLFVGVLLIADRAVKIFIMRLMNSDENREGSDVSLEDKEDPRVFWDNEGLRREPELADYELLEEDFFENERTEFPENFEDEFRGISDEEADEILFEAGIYDPKGE